MKFCLYKTNLSYTHLAACSNKSGIGGILKGLGLKGKSNSSKFNDSDSDLQISSEHTREFKSRNTFPTAAVQKNNNKKPPNRAGKC